MSSYLFIIKSELPLVIGTFLDMDPEGDWFLKGNLLIIIVSVLIILPLALMRHLGSVEAEMLHMYSQQDLLILCVRLAVLLAVTLTVPVVLFPIRRALQQLLFPSKAFSWPRHVAIALILLVLVNVLVICVPTIRDIFGVIGSTSAPSLIFILPSVFYLRIVPSEVEPLYSWPKIQ
ncbi:Sodium-coupled neutral amino acid transporter 5, partial [Eschrichtius robustus]|nr:Sodium-coupled neutral amino acid transporter 5 [Eschrichtius robustus]